MDAPDYTSCDVHQIRIVVADEVCILSGTLAVGDDVAWYPHVPCILSRCRQCGVL
jgi:hypothetical protein